MRLNDDFSKRVVIRPDDHSWTRSPAGGVERVMLERVGQEIARATSLVHYAPGSEFPEHEHSGGEEILVIMGTLVDEHGRYPAGTYLRNPPGTRHSPRSVEGCKLFVKLRQFQPDDLAQKVIHTGSAAWSPGMVDKLSVLSLHQHGTESTALVRWSPGSRFPSHAHWGGEEIFVIDGVFEDEHGEYPAGTWIRSPHLSRHSPASSRGCLIYVKTGHLISPLSASSPQIA